MNIIFGSRLIYITLLFYFTLYSDYLMQSGIDSNLFIQIIKDGFISQGLATTLNAKKNQCLNEILTHDSCHTLSVVHCDSCLFSTVQLLTMTRKCCNLTDCHYMRLFTRTHHSQLKHHLVPFIVQRRQVEPLAEEKMPMVLNYIAR